MAISSGAATAINTLSPAHAVLINCARVELDTHSLGALSTLLDRIDDWPGLLDLADRHRLTSLLFKHLAAHHAESIPKEAYARLWGRQQLLLRRNCIMASELQALLRALDSEAIPALPYKGPTLALAAYGDIGLREFGDLDLLVPARDVFRASRLLQDVGYRPRFRVQPSDEQRFLTAGRQYDLELYNEDRDILVELHWRTDRRFAVESIDDPAWWRELTSVPAGDACLSTLRTPELLFALCIHGLKHDWERLAWLVDVAELSRQMTRADWTELLGASRRLRCRLRIAVSLRLVVRLLVAPVPAGLLEDLGMARVAKRHASRIASTLTDPSYRPPGVVRRQWHELLLYDHGPQRIAHVRELLFTPNAMDWEEDTDEGVGQATSLLRRFRRLCIKYLFGNGQ